MKRLKATLDDLENRTVVVAVVFFLLGALGGYLAFRQSIDDEMKEALLTD